MSANKTPRVAQRRRARKAQAAAQAGRLGKACNAAGALSLRDPMDRLGLVDLAALQAKLTAAITQRGREFAGRAVDFGSDALDLVVGFCIAMYLLFFLLRDGQGVARDFRAALPLAHEVKALLLERFTTVIRATVKGNILVAAAQGALGGLAFWVPGVHAPMLWAVVMAFLSLQPAVGAALIWAPVALYLLATAQVWQGFGLIAFGVLVIGLIDNVSRSILVGKETQLPDYVVPTPTVGGLSVFGFNTFLHPGARFSVDPDPRPQSVSHFASVPLMLASHADTSDGRRSCRPYP